MRSLHFIFNRVLRLNSRARSAAQRVSLADNMSGAKNAKSFYGVRKGRETGVYNTWDECKSKINSFSGAQFKKFKTESEAWNYVLDLETINFDTPFEDDGTPAATLISSKKVAKTTAPTTKAKVKELRKTKYLPLNEVPQPSTGLAASTSGPVRNKAKHKRGTPYDLPRRRIQTRPIDEKLPTVYTDGACTQNGRDGARAGIGVYWGPNHELNVSEALPGRQTNNRAEIHAAVRALEQARACGFSAINLATDSYFLIQGITSWIHKWKRNGWKLSTGEPVINKEDFQQLEAASHGIDINWVHVRGHQGDEGNEAADRLARAGVQT